MKMNSNTSIKKFLFPLTFILALLTVIAGSPYKISIQPININEMFDIDGKLVKVIDVQKLANWIMKKKDDYYLLDIRPKHKFSEYHIPFALSLSSGELQNTFFSKKESIIIYDTNSRYVIKHIKPIIDNRKEQVYLLKGGMEEWFNKVLFPDLTENSGLSENEIDKIYKRSIYFGGKPTLDRKRSKRQYKREGC
jgi:rhodanese-related sulfurtransferase